MMLPSKEKLIRKVHRGIFFQNIFNIITIIALAGIVYQSYIQYELDLFTFGTSISTFVILAVTYFYARYLNNRIRLNLYIARNTIDNYEEVKQIMDELLHDKPHDARKKQDSKD